MVETRGFGFQVLGRSSTTEARRGVLQTRHGEVQTPVFMPVGTLGLVKGLDPRDLAAMGARMVLANAYHLMLRPGSELVRQLGGLHRFTGHDGPILTDSGGFQVFSLAGLRKVTDEGVSFRSHIDGSSWFLSPEKLVAVQEDLGPDVAMVLDECPPGTAGRDGVARAMARTTAWARRCLDARTREDMALFGIVQGGTFEDLRSEHAAELCEMPFDGFAVGGVSVGEAPEAIARVVRHTAPLLPQDKPRYLMGVGTPEDLVRSVAAGIDMFDCVLPSRNARNGQLFTWGGKINIRNARHRASDLPVDERCVCYTCKTYSRAFLRHQFTSGELSYFRLATLHNVTFFVSLMAEIRTALEADTFDPALLLRRLAGEEG